MEKGGTWVVIDDFVWPVSKGYIDQAVVEGVRIRYLDRKGNALRENERGSSGSPTTERTPESW
jgi:hypothetical protein